MQRGNRRLRRSLIFRHFLMLASHSALIILALALTSCSVSNERVAPFAGSITSEAQIDCSDVVGYLIYDKQIDGLLDDTTVFYSDELCEFRGLLLYEFPVNITSERLQKHAHLIIPDLTIDTFLTVEIHGADIDAFDEVNHWDIQIQAADFLQSK